MIIKGIPEFEASLRHKVEATRAATRAATEASGALFVQEEQANAPKVSGALEGSIRASGVRQVGEDAFETQVGPHVPYGHRIEAGFHGADAIGRHYDESAEPYIEPAYDAAREEVPMIYARAWAEALTV